MVFSQEIFKILDRTVATSNQNNLRRKSFQNTQVTKIRVLRYYDKSLALSVVADVRVTSSIETECENMFTNGE